MRVQSNVQALNAWNKYTQNNTALSKTLEQLSSGFRVNRAADDAAGLAISQKMRAQITGLDRAVLNVHDGISLVQVAEGALGEVHGMLNRISELAVEASNGVYGDSERTSIQREIDDLIGEIDRISGATNFNGINLLDGSAHGRQAPPTGVAATVGENTILTVYDFETTQTTGGFVGLVGTQYDALRDMLKKEIVPNAVQSILNAYSATFSYLDGSSIGIGLNLYRDTRVSTAASLATATNGATAQSYQLNVNLAYFDLDGDGALDPAQRTRLESTIAHEIMHALMDEAQTVGMVSGDRYPTWYIEGMAQSAGGGMDWVKSTLGANPSDATIRDAFSQLNAGYGASAYSYGYLATMYLGYMAAGGGGVTAAGIAGGLDTINAACVSGESLNEAIAANTKYTGLADFQVNLKNDADAYSFVRSLIAAAGSNGRGALVAGDLAAENVLPDAELDIRLFALNTSAGFVVNEYPSTVNVWSGGGAYGGGTAPDAGYTGGPRGPFWPGGGGSGAIVLQIGAEVSDTLVVDITSTHLSSLGVSHLSVRDVDSANLSIELARAAIDTVSSIRGGLGAIQNRLEHTLQTLQNTSENMTRAESLLRDMDMAKGMMAFTKQNILSQAAQTMLAQANQAPSQVLRLLQA